MKQEMALLKPTPISEWSDLDWANRLGCPITEIPNIKKYMQENFSSMIVTEKNTGKRYVQVYRHEITPSESIRPIQIYASELRKRDFVEEANEMIANLEMTPFWARALNVPKGALQMLYIR